MTIFCEFSWLDSIIYVYPMLSYDMVLYIGLCMDLSHMYARGRRPP